jgi:hypothetical protein
MNCFLNKFYFALSRKFLLAGNLQRFRRDGWALSPFGSHRHNKALIEPSIEEVKGGSHPCWKSCSGKPFFLPSHSKNRLIQPKVKGIMVSKFGSSPE